MSRKQTPTEKRVTDVLLVTILLPLILPLAIIGLVLYFLNLTVVYLLVWIWWLPRGRDVLYVTSESTIWKEYMENEVLPLVAKRAIVLNWSGRKSWRQWSFTVRAFHTFSQGRDFNPMVVLFRPFQRAKTFRFLPAFQERKHGNLEDLEKLRQELIQSLG